MCTFINFDSRLVWTSDPVQCFGSSWNLQIPSLVTPTYQNGYPHTLLMETELSSWINLYLRWANTVEGRTLLLLYPLFLMLLLLVLREEVLVCQLFWSLQLWIISFQRIWLKSKILLVVKSWGINCCVYLTFLEGEGLSFLVSFLLILPGLVKVQNSWYVFSTYWS